MATKPVTVGDLIHRVASSCLSNRLPCNYTLRDSIDSNLDDDDDPFADAVSSSEKCQRSPSAAEAEEIEEEEGGGGEAQDLGGGGGGEGEAGRRCQGRRACPRRGRADCGGVRRRAPGRALPLDPDKMCTTDAAVVVELCHLARLRDRFCRRGPHPTPEPFRAAPPRGRGTV
ncbi:unnamed protein product [Miscanthus lutarioriparius]|uniref:Uncharacterized protein n=1 Tax=Miscanthus lutarioriparius TaxID=422564 RepID=A0A811NCS6_9POAL|nr:unnamed protein product [Miscanthus lutarioriparius]